MRLEVLIGMIASGKSTYARHRADEGALVVCHDDLTEMLHKRYRYEADLKNLYRYMMEGIVNNVIAVGRDVVIDRTNLTAQARHAWLAIAAGWRFGLEAREVTAVAVVFPLETPNVHANRRTMTDGRGRDRLEWLAVAKHHAAQMDAEPPTVERLTAEGFDSVVEVTSVDIERWAAEPNPFPAYLPPRDQPRGI